MFIEEYLQDLRRERFRPPALATYARRAAGRMREHLVANPGAVRSVWSLALGFFAAAFLAAAVMAVGYDRPLATDFFVATTLCILPVFALVTMHLDLLRDRDGYRLSAINLPTALTLLRVSLAPGIILFLADRHFSLALGAFLLAALTDVADGWLARRWGQTTRLGMVLDPIVDILFNLAIFTGLALAHLLPAWVLAVAVVRYGILLLGGASLYVFVGPLRIRPTTFGRLTGIISSALVAFLMVLHTIQGRLGETLVPLTEIAIGALLVATVGQVVALGWYNLRVMTGAAPPAGAVVGDVRWGAQ
jgi:cardiolipin synthase